MAEDAPIALSPVQILERHYLAQGIEPVAAHNLAVWNADKPLAKYLGDARPILDKLAEGRRVADVAAEIGVSRSSLLSWLLDHAPEAWRAISAGNALARLDSVEDDLDQAESMVQVSKARERANNAKWALERVARKHYSPRPEESAGGVNITVRIDRGIDGSITLDHDPD